jgi:hypothetical protein
MDDTPSNIQRLQQLAESRHAIITEPLAALSRPSAASTTCSAADRSAAIQLLQGQSRKSKQSDFDYKEIHVVLQDVVKRGREQGVIVALIEMLLNKGGNVNISRESRSLMQRYKVNAKHSASQPQSLEDIERQKSSGPTKRSSSDSNNLRLS